MFAESLLEVSWAQRTRRSWTTLTSFGLQAVVISLLLLLPLWETVGLPRARTVSTPITMGRPAADPATRPRAAGSSLVPNNSNGIRFVQPGHIPTVIITGPDVGDSQPLGKVGDFIGIGDPTGPPLALNTGNWHAPLPVPPAPSVRAFRPSTLLEGSLIRRVQPTYPQLARNARIQGPVILDAIISKDGTIENLRLVSGHPMLVAAAIDAVRQWRYRPYVLNGETIEVETQITVNFILSGN